MKVYKDTKDVEKYSFDAADVRDPRYNEETVESKTICSRLRESLDEESIHHRFFRKRGS